MRPCWVELSSPPPRLGTCVCALFTQMDTIWLRLGLFAAKTGAAVSRANPETVAAKVSLAIIGDSLNEEAECPASFGPGSSLKVKN